MSKRMIGRILKLLVVGSLCLGGASSLTRAESAQRTRLSAPTPDVLLMLVRTALVALNQANFTGNYSVLRDLGTPQLQASHSQAQLGIAFTNLREQRLDLSRVLLLAPELTEPPSVANDGTLRLAGVFPTSPVQISFAMAFRPVAGVWRIEGLSVRTLPPPGMAAATASGHEVPMPVRKTR
ncbi:MAG: hypothetical protein WEA81_05445 [Dehalococcoidia bacterium]